MMPIRFEIDRPNQCVSATADGLVGSDELQAFLGDVIAAEAMTYSKLFDVSNARLRDSAKLAEVAVTVRLYEEVIEKCGPVAIVIREGMDVASTKRFVAVAAANHRVRFFTDQRAAADWLNTRKIELSMNAPLH
jgi:hypothetical protein